MDDPLEIEPVVRDPGDDYLVALARSAAAHALVSGDGDLLALDLEDVLVLSPRAFLERLGSMEPGRGGS